MFTIEISEMEIACVTVYDVVFIVMYNNQGMSAAVLQLNPIVHA